MRLTTMSVLTSFRRYVLYTFTALLIAYIGYFFLHSVYTTSTIDSQQLTELIKNVERLLVVIGPQLAAGVVEMQ